VVNKKFRFRRKNGDGIGFEKTNRQSIKKLKKIKAMTLVKFNRPVTRGFGNLVDDFFNEVPAFFNDGFNKSISNVFVPVNVKESEGSYQLDVVAPGFDKADFKINLDGNILTISAEKKAEEKNENEKQVRNEYKYRSFKRSFTLDEKTDASNIDAKYINGVLILNLPKKAEVKEAVKEISVK
jgi:HSP20 family protein